MDEKLIAYPEPTGGFVIARDEVAAAEHPIQESG